MTISFMIILIKLLIDLSILGYILYKNIGTRLEKALLIILFISTISISFYPNNLGIFNFTFLVPAILLLLRNETTNKIHLGKIFIILLSFTLIIAVFLLIVTKNLFIAMLDFNAMLSLILSVEIYYKYYRID